MRTCREFFLEEGIDLEVAEPDGVFIFELPASHNYFDGLRNRKPLSFVTALTRPE